MSGSGTVVASPDSEGMESVITINDVAAHVLDVAYQPLSSMSLQKLCYLSQGWSLGLRGEPLFREDLRAQDSGPVNLDLLVQYENGPASASRMLSAWPTGDPAVLDEMEAALVAAVVTHYEVLSGPQLSELTKRPGSPWAQSRQLAEESGFATEEYRPVISKDLMAAFFADQAAQADQEGRE